MLPESDLNLGNIAWRENKQERAEMMAKKKIELKKKMANDKVQKDKIAQAMARVKKTKQPELVCCHYQY